MGRPPCRLLRRRRGRSTQHYARVDLTRLAEKVASSGYLERNAALVEVLLDVEGLANGETEDVLYYDLGHGLCANPYWAKCPYRMACVRCPMYVPGEDAQYVRAKEGVRRMMETVPLTEEERLAAAEGDGEALSALLNRDAKVPVPADRDRHQAPIVPLRKKGTRTGASDRGKDGGANRLVSEPDEHDHAGRGG